MSTGIELPLKVLFVCLGNICRSPLAEGTFRHHLAKANLKDKFIVDSCGTGNWHIGHAPDPGSVRVAAEHDLDISAQKSRQVTLKDLQEFDQIIAMDSSNQANLVRLAAVAESDPEKISLLRDYEIFKDQKPDVPDPYGLTGDAFGEVFEIVERCTESLLEKLIERYKLNED